MNNICILIHSCDLYEEAWLPFFSLFRKYWPDCGFPIYLSTESCAYNDSSIKTINTGSGVWTRRLHNAIEKIDEEFIFLFLEDFFLQKEVNLREIERAINIISSDNNVSCIYFNKIHGYSKKSKYDNYTLMSPDENTRYLLNCQASLWRKEVLFQACSMNGDAWEFEEHGFEKLPSSIRGTTFLCYNLAWYDKIGDNDVFSYLLTRDSGYGIWKSRWLWNNQKLFKKNGIAVKYVKLKKMSHFSFSFSRFFLRIKDFFLRLFN